MAVEPPVLTRLKALGLSQKTLAAYIGASPAAVSMWCTGKNPFAEPWVTEARALLAVLHEHLAHGGSLDTFRYRPALFMNPGGVTFTGETAPLTDAALADLVKLRETLRSLPPAHRGTILERWHFTTEVQQLAQDYDVDPLTWTPSAHEADTLRRRAEALRLFAVWILQDKALAAMEDTSHAHETP
jgi:transcriptional regulator with XRE-family HTH domain